VDLALEAIADLREPRVLDVGTGSGALILAIVDEHRGARGWACDNSAEALTLAKENGKFTGLGERITWIKSDLQDPGFASVFNTCFDLVVSNPPYVSEEEYRRLPDEVREWEPRQALLAGPEGLDAIARLAQVSGELLSPGGSLIIEIGERQGHSSARLFETHAWHTLVKKDLSGKDRYLWAKAG
jgi:release factor glutamine methyltransferase